MAIGIHKLIPFSSRSPKRSLLGSFFAKNGARKAAQGENNKKEEKTAAKEESA
ncbi:MULTISPECIES: hypothetical protein [Geobacillus]|uniref:hypothetical protein n=1 Tax=Geobacillus TaxID=129337 RepID=UPI000AB9FE83|nr:MULTISPECIES: hypothetical protein [Geobacillus]